MPDEHLKFRPTQMYHRTLPPDFAKTKERLAELEEQGYVTHYIPGEYPMRMFHPTDPSVEGVTITSAMAAKPAEMKKYEGWVDTPAIARKYAENPMPPAPPGINLNPADMEPDLPTPGFVADEPESAHLRKSRRG